MRALRLIGGEEEKQATTSLIQWIIRIILVIVVLTTIIGIVYYFLGNAQTQTTNIGKSITGTSYTVGQGTDTGTVNGNGTITLPTTP
jgi:flagellar basal body-associated protein FliL